MADEESQPASQEAPLDDQQPTENAAPSTETGDGNEQITEQTGEEQQKEEAGQPAEEAGQSAEETGQPVEEAEATEDPAEAEANTNKNEGRDEALPTDGGQENAGDEGEAAEVTEGQTEDVQEKEVLAEVEQDEPQRRAGETMSPAEMGGKEEEPQQRALGMMAPAEKEEEQEEPQQRAVGMMAPAENVEEQEEEPQQRAVGMMAPAEKEEEQEEEPQQRARGMMPPIQKEEQEETETQATETENAPEEPAVKQQDDEQGKQEEEEQEAPSADVMSDGIPIPPGSGPPLPQEGDKSRAASSAAQDQLGMDVTPNALNMTWSFGVNKYIPAINLTDQHRKMVIYVCGNTAVLSSYDKNTQKLLQGHCNNITCICASQDKRWVATADKGENSMIIIWDTYSGTPVQTIFDPHPDGGVVGINMTLDAKYIVTLSAAKKQTLSIWDWTTNGEYPVASKELGVNYGQQTYVMFNPEDHYQIVSNSPTQVIFYKWGGDKIEFFAPPLTDQDFNRVVGNFSQSIFCQNSTRALTATAAGNVVVWDNNRPTSGPPTLEPSPNKKAFKLVRLQERGITVLTTTERFVVTGDTLGHVKFYDLQLRMSNWYSELNVGPINAVSFSYVPDFNAEAKPDSNYPKDATIHAKSFVTRDYIVSTSNAQVALVVADGVQVKMILEEHDKPIHALTTHPSQ